MPQIRSFEGQLKISLVTPDLNELGREPHRKKYCIKILSSFIWYRDLVLDVVNMIVATFQTSDNVYLGMEFGKPVDVRLGDRYESRVMFESSRYPSKFTKFGKFTHLNLEGSC